MYRYFFVNRLPARLGADGFRAKSAKEAEGCRRAFNSLRAEGESWQRSAGK